MAVCRKQCADCPMLVTVLIQGRCDCSELSELTRDIIHEDHDNCEKAIAFMIGAHDIITPCTHSTRASSSYDSSHF